MSTRPRATAEQDQITSLIALQLDRGKWRDMHGPRLGHAEGRITNNPVYRDALSLMEVSLHGSQLGLRPASGGSALDIRKASFDYPASRDAAHKAIRATAHAYFEKLGKLSEGFGVDLQECTSSPTVPTQDVPIEDYNRLLRAYIDLSSRVAQLESRFAHVGPPAAYPGTDSVGTATPSPLRTPVDLSDALPIISEAFTYAFGVENPSLRVEIEEDEADFPVSVTIDVTSADRNMIAEARANGARANFYRRLSTGLDSAVLDQVDFHFVFPKNESE